MQGIVVEDKYLIMNLRGTAATQDGDKQMENKLENMKAQKEQNLKESGFLR